MSVALEASQPSALATPRFVVEEHTISLAHVRPISPDVPGFRLDGVDESTGGAELVRVVNLAATRWRAVQHSRGSRDLDRCWSSALPNAMHRRPPLSGVPPNRLRWRLQVCDRVGSRVVDAVIQVYWLIAPNICGGGAFVQRFWIELDELVVDSAFDLNLRLLTSRPRNVGTSRSPIACLPASLVGTVTGVDAVTPIDRRFEIWGDGSFHGIG